MKKFLSVVVLLCMTAAMLSFSACASGEAGENNSKEETGLKKIGIIQIMEHTSLNEIRKSILKRLEEKGYKDGENITVDYQNAQGDQINLKTISQKFVSSKYDMIIAIATPSAQVAAGETSEIPIVFSACTDPVSAGLVKDLDKPGKNITGTSDLISAEYNMKLAQRITPGIKTIGALYNSSEANSLLIIKHLKEYADKSGLDIVEGTVTNTSEVQQVAQSLAEKADAIFSPVDNTIASSMPMVSEIAVKAKKPLYVGADSMVKDGGLASCGINYEILGRETADMVIDIFNGKKPGDIPVKIMKDINICVNKDIAKRIGITIPEDVLKEAVHIFGN
ncbi:putative ABC transport system substrate-binding protein [Ruminiclostridium sufflavum DSM 19573]|uniref:Putative ABC transport system substrate-binding protein n=1 Tax=Ruminiclostridium sufflavum DSM 19573 TaxID=1121337 RepID=A0A318XRU6_9FIRM|nr:ABC transporter substrate-binding protein [Ruminiclostridium sufflavum]PYG90224.1 putative ABC transport system substrate-binding protein [Ruminiclostridium sufflavum DSM 19573]